MALLPRAGGRLLARLTRSAPADPGACSGVRALQPYLDEFPPGLWGSSSLRYLAGGEEPLSRPAGPVPPPPATPAAHRHADQPQPLRPATSPSPSSATAPPDSSSTPPPNAASGPVGGPATSSESPMAASSDPSSASASASESRPRAGSKDASETKAAAGATSAEDNDLRYKHRHFAVNEQMQKLQPVLEEAERRKAYDALVALGDGTRWSLLYDSPLARLLAVVLQPLRAAMRGVLLPGVLARLQTTSERMIREDVELSFDAQEFLDGVNEAVPAFYDAVVADDTQALRRMASAKALEAIERDRRRLREEHGLEVTSASTTVNSSALGGVNLWGPTSIRGFDPEWAKDLMPGMSKSWLVVVVHLDVKLDVMYRLVRGGAKGASGPGAGGEGGGGGEVGEALEVQGVVRRAGSWLLARGPLPPGSVRSLDCRWRVVGWW